MADKQKSEMILTLGIPTYNGAEYLPLAINSIVRNIPKGKESLIEILISDNASYDNTKEIVKNLQNEFPNLISYFRNDINVGYDKNVDLVVKRAKGVYVKFLGDDDEMLPGSIEKIISEIYFDSSLEVIVHSVRFIDLLSGNIIESDHKILNTRFFHDNNIFFQETKWATAALSSLVICKKSWINCNLEKYIGSQWIHLGGLIEILKNQGTSLGISNQLAIVRLNNDRWSLNNGSQLSIGIKHLSVMRNLLKSGYKKKTFQVFLIDRYKHNLKDIRQLRSNEFHENIKTSISMMRLFWPFPKFWIFHIPVLLLGDKYVLMARNIKYKFK